MLGAAVETGKSMLCTGQKWIEEGRLFKGQPWRPQLFMYGPKKLQKCLRAPFQGAAVETGGGGVEGEHKVWRNRGDGGIYRGIEAGGTAGLRNEPSRNEPSRVGVTPLA